MKEENKRRKLLFENEYSRFELENDIIIATWKSSFVDLKIAQQVVQERLAAISTTYPVLVKINGIKDSTKEARDFLASEKGGEGFSAVALYVHSTLETIIANLFIFLNKPKVPTKIFKDETKAKEWLKQYIKPN